MTKVLIIIMRYKFLNIIIEPLEMNYVKEKTSGNQPEVIHQSKNEQYETLTFVRYTVSYR